jgi:hypothetical protein
MRRSALESIDKALTNPWLSRISNVWFVWGLLTLGWAYAAQAADLVGPGSLALLSGFALIFLLAVGGALRRWFTQRRGEQMAPPAEPVVATGLLTETMKQVMAELEHFVDSDSDAQRDLDVVIEQEEWDAFQYEAHILEMRVRVTNNTGTRKTMTGFQLETRGAAKASANITVQREVEARKHRHPRLDHHSIVEPKTTVTGWLVYAWDWPVNGPPDYTLKITDELNVQHEARRKESLSSSS